MLKTPKNMVRIGVEAILEGVVSYVMRDNFLIFCLENILAEQNLA
jgi:hypothetical protein